MRRRRKVSLGVTLLLLLLALVIAHLRRPFGEWRVVARVVDGDTLVLDGGDRVRLIGVNTPESHPPECYGKEAAEFTRSLLEGRRVRLEFESSGQDRYGRTLA